LEFLLQKKSGDLSGWITYTLGGASKKFTVYNSGHSFPSDEDRRHELKNVLKYTLGNWTFANTTVFSTGKPYTAAQSQYYIDLLNGEQANYLHVGLKNEQRLPSYFRLDISASYEIKFKLFSIETGLSLFNLTNHKNIWHREYNLETFPVVINDVQTLGLTPTLFINFKTF
jgi:outer membrane receptor protein involved in Fe transport